MVVDGRYVGVELSDTKKHTFYLEMLGSFMFDSTPCYYWNEVQAVLLLE